MSKQLAVSNEAVFDLAGELFIRQPEEVTELQEIVRQLSAQLDRATAARLDAAVGAALAAVERHSFDVGLWLGRNPDKLLFRQE